ncbi:MAG: Fe-S cluster assembly protein SufD [Acidobacteria bacterium RBG_16_68_9]|nr:MAG: Fe-S cluster assembly protein SufD [Acidobacteria bacterium RBG_16_68_9]
MTEHFVGQYRAFASNGAAGAPEWLRSLRERAIARFAAVGFPSTRLEEWRFTNIQAVAETPFTLSGMHWDAGRIPAGATVAPLGEAMQRWPDLVRAHLARYATVEANPFTALATAFLADGLLVHVPAGVVIDEPIQLTCRIPPGAARPMAHPRLLIVLERAAQAKVVEIYDGASGMSLTNAVTEIVLEAGAHLDLCREQRDGAQSYHIATTQSHQERDSRLVCTTVALGAALSRHDIHAVLDGSGAYLILNGLSVLGQRQHVDHHTTIEHARPHCESHEYFNGIFDGESHGVFNGRIIVHPGAQRTDSKQTNNNLLLSEAARADSQPQLEIYADDVKCTHGSTVGPLDPTALFYLRSRGLGAAAARGLLTYGFGAEILDRVVIPGVRERLDRLIRDRLGVPELEPGA